MSFMLIIIIPLRTPQAVHEADAQTSAFFPFSQTLRLTPVAQSLQTIPCGVNPKQPLRPCQKPGKFATMTWGSPGCLLHHLNSDPL